MWLTFKVSTNAHYPRVDYIAVVIMPSHLIWHELVKEGGESKEGTPTLMAWDFCVWYHFSSSPCYRLSVTWKTMGVKMLVSSMVYTCFFSFLLQEDPRTLQKRSKVGPEKTSVVCSSFRTVSTGIKLHLLTILPKGVSPALSLLQH